MPSLRVRLGAGRRTAAGAVTVRLDHLSGGGLSGDLDAAILRGLSDADRHLDAAVLDRLPTRGGFAAELARRAVIQRSRIRGGWRLQVDGKGADVARINAGRLRHRVWGHDRWVDQMVRRGFADAALEQIGEDVDREIRRTVEGGR